MAPEESPATVDLKCTQPQAPGTSIGPYKLLQQIGEGGMGVVFMAEQHEPFHRVVALKVIVPGIDSRQVIARFEAERQVLAMMDHPNIARVLDAGTTESGRPYFVMELVKGVPITAYCDEKKLTLRERLELFMPVCHAVQHAHQKGIIHRDIKPSNVLVADYDDKAVPKVIDFGIAKATSQKLTDKTMFTAFGQVVGTMEYMSPEQTKLNQLDVDTRTDIYSLGVLLYELLTGTTPFDRKRLQSAAIDEVYRIIREEEPIRPSTSISKTSESPAVATSRRSDPVRLSRMLQGDLDWIVMKALEKDRTRRYPTANGLASDIERYLNDAPVSAGPPSASYRMQKFVRRNRGLIAAGSAIVLVLLVGLAASIWQAVRATRAEALAIAETDAKEDALRQAVKSAEAERKARQEEAKQRQQAEWVSKVLVSAFRSPDPLRDGRTITIAEMLDRAAKEVTTAQVADPQYKFAILESIGGSYLALGLPAQAIPLLQEVHSQRENTLDAADKARIESSIILATALLEANRPDGAIRLGEQFVLQCRKCFGETNRMTLEATHILTRAYQATLNADKGLPLCEMLVRTSKEVLGQRDRLTVSAMSTLGDLYSMAGRKEESLAVLEEVVSLMSEHPDDPFSLTTMAGLGQLFIWSGRADYGQKMIEKSYELLRSKLGPTHRTTLAAGRQLVWRYASLNQLERAIPLQYDLVENTRNSLGAAHTSTVETVNYLVALFNLAGRPQEAIPVVEGQLSRLSALQGPDHIDSLTAERNVAEQYRIAGRANDAASAYDRLLRRMTLSVGPHHPLTLTTLEWAGRADEAFEGWQALVTQQRTTLSPSDPELLTTILSVAERYESRRQFTEAEAMYRAYIEAARDPMDIAETKVRIGSCLLMRGRYDDGVKQLRDVLMEKIDRLDVQEAKDLKEGMLRIQDKQPQASELPGRAGLDCDGDRDFVLIPNLQFDGIPPWTIEAIVRPIEINVINDFSALVATTDTGGIALETRSKKWAIDLFTADVQRWATASRGIGPWQENYSGALSNQAVELSSWQHVAGVWDGKELRLYLDGVLQDRRAGVELCTRLSHGPFYLAADPAGLSYPFFEDGSFKGRMRAVRISRAAEYDDSFPKKETLENTPGTVGLYDFTRDSGKIAIDWSGHANHGIIVGAKFAHENTSP
jgi:serine/threonine protein kinase/tetratricopeptide (TPR) repeat protein